MQLKDLLELPLDETLGWMHKNQDKYTLEEIKEPCQFCLQDGASQMAYFCPKCGRKLREVATDAV